MRSMRVRAHAHARAWVRGQACGQSHLPLFNRARVSRRGRPRCPGLGEGHCSYGRRGRGAAGQHAARVGLAGRSPPPAAPNCNIVGDMVNCAVKLAETDRLLPLVDHVKPNSLRCAPKPITCSCERNHPATPCRPYSAIRPLPAMLRRASMGHAMPHALMLRSVPQSALGLRFKRPQPCAL